MVLSQYHMLWGNKAVKVILMSLGLSRLKSREFYIVVACVQTCANRTNRPALWFLLLSLSVLLSLIERS